MNLRDHKEWDRINGLLSVSMDPHLPGQDNGLWVLLNGSSGNLCLDYAADELNIDLARQRAWSSDTGYYVKILPDNNVRIISWWNRIEERFSSDLILKNPRKFYKIITKEEAKSATIISFAKETFLRLRNCIQIQDNGQEALRMFMYLLAALNDNIDRAANVDSAKWHLNAFDGNWIAAHDWEMLHTAFKIGINFNGIRIEPLIQLVLRHASNRLFQEAHREATKKSFQLMMFGGADRKYDSGISDGAYYTPTPLVRTIVQEALWSLNKTKPISERDSLRILDPACGSAEFLREALRQLKMWSYQGQIRIDGWDISPTACEIARFVLYYENRTEWNNQVDIQVTERDSLGFDWSQEQPFDMILMNPPFLSFEHLGAKKEIVLQKLRGLTKRQPDAGAVFWKNAADMLKDDGSLGLILPHSFLSAETYDNLRNYLKEVGMNFSLIGRLGSAGLFEKAMIIPAILVGIKRAVPISNTALWTDYKQVSAYEALRELRIYRLNEIPTPTVNPSYSIYENQFLTSSKKNWSVNSYRNYLLAKELKDFSTVGNFFSITQGVQTGNNSAFLIKKEELLNLLPKKEREYFRPIVMGGSIENGRINDSVYCFYPYGSKTIASEAELIEKLPIFYDLKLKTAKEKLKKRTSYHETWWLLRRPTSIPNSPKLLSAFFGKAGYFAVDEKGIFLVGQGFAWIPKSDLINEEFQFAYLALLHAPIIDSLLEMISVNVAGGQFDLSKRYVETMPLPDLTQANPELFNYLLQKGKDIHNGVSINKSELNDIVSNAYGVNLDNLK